MKNIEFINRKRWVEYENAILAACLTVASLYINHFWVEKPLQAKVMEQRRNRGSLEEDKAGKETLLQNSATIERQWDFYMKYFRQKFNEEEQLSEFLSQIEKMAENAHLTMNDRTPQKVKKADLINIYSFDLVLEGDMKSLAEFLYHLQNEPYLFEIDQLRLEKNPSQNSQLKCFLTVSRVMIPSKEIVLKEVF